MNKVKKRVLYLSLILTILVVLSFYVIGDMLGSASVVSSGGTYESSTNNSFIGADSKMFNLTITYGDLNPGNDMNITAFNVSLGAAANYSLFEFVAISGEIVLNVSNISDSAVEIILDNVTFWSDASDAGWYCSNTSATSFGCNTSEPTSINPTNTSLYVMFNVSGASSVENTVSWDILAWPTDDGSQGNANGTNITIYVDTLAPRHLETNLSDGNTTIMNDTFVAYGMDSVYLDYTDLTLTARLEELDVDALWLYLQNNDSANATSYVYTYKVKMSDDGMNIFTTTISTAQLINENVSSFVFVANDTEGNTVYLNNTDVSAESPFAFFINSSDVIRVGRVEVNDSYTNNHSLTGTGLNDASADYLAAGNVIISAEISGLNKNDTKTYIVWNNTGSILYSGALAQFDSNTFQEYVEMTNITVVNNTDIATFEYTVPLTGNDSNKFVFYIVSNNTGDNYTAVVGPFNFTIDGTSPSSPVITLDSPAGATSVETSSSVEYSCSASDALSAVSSYSWELTKPDGSTVSKTGSSATFSDTDTNQAGDYTIKCTAEDAVGYTTTSTTTLSVVYGSGGGTTTGGGGGGGTAAPTFDVNLAVEDSGTIQAKQGYVKTFTFDGATKHTISFKTIDTTNNKVVLKISSVPVEITLGIGEMREVDINGDGMNDLSVTLEEIRGGKAEITIKKLEAGAEVIAREERKAAGVEEEVGVEEVEEIIPEEGIGVGNLILIIAIVLIIIGVGYYFMKKK